ncbi:ORF62 [Retroperitoneal fibromatosis-associated herpesvirus]|uniref:ORF62 n=1 Tax=Retroperitoneal fibromatosis-associated herpesvirus TaxID=111469 RepID=U5NM82_9GAMA|nr:ORF62 [Retroperitoneal fibromatosis-associated herpesvirus]AGY30748.1 ORF62 [Retroperitoneal fibromatosis-associated herpesvirus]
MEPQTERLGRQMLNLLPPPTHKVSLTNGPGFARGLRDVLSKYAVSGTLTLDSIQESMWHLPFNQPTYGDFLVYSQTLNAHEPPGTYLFCFKREDNGSTMDTLLTPTSLFKLSGADADVAPQTHKVASLWYGNQTGIADLIPDLRELMDTGAFHEHLAPVGPLVQGVHSTFVTKVTSAVKGVGLARDPPHDRVGLALPGDMFVDLDESSPFTGRRDPVRARVTIYACVIYVRVNNQPAMSLMFFQSGKGFSDVVACLKDYYTDVIRTRYIQMRYELYINKMFFGAVCKLGTVPADRVPSHRSIPFKGASFPLLVFSDFFAAAGPWQIFL